MWLPQNPTITIPKTDIMWVTTPALLPLIPPQQTATLTRRRHPLTTAAAAAPKDVSGLGQAVLKALKSSPVPKSNPNKTVKPEGRRKKKEGEEENSDKELNGSDILWALQKASAKKARVSVNNSKKKVQNGNGSNGSGLRVKSEDANRVVDYDNVRPIVVKSDWVTRLDDLEKRLNEFSIL